MQLITTVINPSIFHGAAAPSGLLLRGFHHHT